jgi:hypothetical protein
MGGLLILFIVTAINAGVISFALTFRIFRSMRWPRRLTVGLSVGLLAFIGQWFGLFLFAGSEPGVAIPMTLLVLYALFNAVSLYALWSIIVWLRKRKVIGSLSVVKQIALPMAWLGALTTLGTFVLLISIVGSYLYDLISA